jgi:hypothetical protein
MTNESNDSHFRASLVIAAGLVLSTIIASWAILHFRTSDHIIVVTGSARKRIKSDLIVWRVNVTQQSPLLADAYRTLSDNSAKVRAYLVGKGIADGQIVSSSITTKPIHAKGSGPDYSGNESGPIVSYQLEQSLEIRSPEVDKISQISREVTELINQGILIESVAPEYHYTKLGDLKIEMLAEASKDAKARAQQIASSTGDRIGGIRAAKMGVLQITPADSNRVSDSGENDTTSLDKDITAVVSISFAVD